MVAILKSKTHLLNTFFNFLSHFLRVWLQSLKKVLIWPKIFFFFNQKRFQNFTLISNPLKKLLKNAPKKIISKTSLTNMSKSEKSAYFRQVFANNFFLVNFFKPFSTDSKSARNSVFFIPILNFCKKKFFLLLFALFLDFHCKCAGNGSKKRKIVFYECVLEFNLATIKGFA